MKHIIAYIKPHKLPSVTLALHRIKNLTGMTRLNVDGCGRGMYIGEDHSTEQELCDYIPHIKLEIFCLDKLSEEVVSTIQKKAHTGLKGDGKIYISNVEDAIRISSDERGEKAV